MEDTDTQQKMTNKERFRNRFKERHPDYPFEDEEDFFSKLYEDYDGFENESKRYHQEQDELLNLFSSDPRSAAFLSTWYKKGDPIVELVRNFGKDIIAIAEDPDRLPELEAADKEYSERVARQNELQEQYEKNRDETLKRLAAFAKSKGYADDKIDDAMEKVVKIANDFIVGIITEETMEFIFKAINHDADVNTAGEDGEVRGRNSKIKETIRKSKEGDGVANLDGGSVDGRRQPEVNDGGLSRIAAKGDIFERGNEKRYRHG